MWGDCQLNATKMRPKSNQTRPESKQTNVNQIGRNRTDNEYHQGNWGHVRLWDRKLGPNPNVKSQTINIDDDPRGRSSANPK